MSGYVDLHCHFVAQIDDGCRTVEESAALLSGLHALGFRHVVATPHMRPGMFDNDQSGLRRAYLSTLSELSAHLAADERPALSLGSEHFFDALVVEAIHRGEGLPYAPDDEITLTGARHRGTILIEFQDLTPLTVIEAQIFRLVRSGYTPVIAHPERYRQVWREPELVGRLQDLGSVALLDSGALVGKYGQNAQDCSRQLLRDGFYHAACSDAHRPADVRVVAQAMTFIREEYGDDEVELLFGQGPGELLAGRRPASML